MFSVNLLHILRTPFPKNISGRLLLILDLEKCSEHTSSQNNSRTENVVSEDLHLSSGKKIRNLGVPVESENV